MTSIKSQNNGIASLCVSNAAINFLILKTFERVAENNIVKMLPMSTNKQNLYTLKSFVSMAHTQNKKQFQFKDESDPATSPLDNFSVNQICLEQNKNLKAINKTEIKSIKTQKSSVRGRKFTNHLHQNQISDSKVINSLQQLPPQIKEETFDPAEQKLRVNYLNFQKQQNQQKKKLLKDQTERDQKKKMNEKIIKDIKKFTYDYEGKIHGQGNGATQMQKLLLIKQKFAELKTIKPNYQTIKNQIVQIQKQKKNEKQKDRAINQPFFSDDQKSIVSYLNDNSIAQGVKISEKGKNSQMIVKQNSNRPTGLKAFKIGQYKSMSQNIKFKQHPRMGSLYQTDSKTVLDQNFKSLQNKKRSAFENRLINEDNQNRNRKAHSKSHFQYNSDQKNRTLDLQKSRNSIESNSQSQFKAKVKYSGLPFIKTKGYRAIDIASQRSFKLEGQDSKISIKKSKKSKIQIDNCQLFSDNFAFQIQQQV